MSDHEPGAGPSGKAWTARDRISGGVMIAIGLWAILEGRTYGFGTLRVVGSGVVPVIVGCLLVLSGTAIALSRELGGKPDESEFTTPDFRLVACVLAGMALFAFLALPAGFVLATLAASLIIGAGVRENSTRDIAIFAVAITTGAVLLFHFLLAVQLPLLGSWFGVN